MVAVSERGARSPSQRTAAVILSVIAVCNPFRHQVLRVRIAILDLGQAGLLGMRLTNSTPPKPSVMP